MAKLKVDDLARMMNIPAQELLFKLRAIGVRVDEADPRIDSEIIQAILEGKKSPSTREVILGDSEYHLASAQRKRPTGRPSRRRPTIHKVEPRIKTLPVEKLPLVERSAQDSAATSEEALRTSSPPMTHGQGEQDALPPAKPHATKATSSSDQMLALQLSEHLKQALQDRDEQQIATLRAELAKAEARIAALARSKRDLSEYLQASRVSPLWGPITQQVDNHLCFLLMPFGESWSDQVRKLINRVAEQCQMRCERADEKAGRVVMSDVWEGLLKARVVIADLTGGNPNVAYEVGLADVLGKDVILLSQSREVPFDFQTSRLLLYENAIGGAEKLEVELKRRLRRLNKR